MAKTEGVIVSRAAQEPSSQRAIRLNPYLNRTLPFWGHPGYLVGERWRWVVKNQPVAIICRDTLISNILSMDWSVRQKEADEHMLKREKDEIDHYTQVIEEAEGGFENLTSLILQDMLDLPFGGMAELGRLDDDPEGPAMWIEHVDGATLFPTQERNWPVMQQVKGAPGKPVVFPKHAISRAYMSPRPEVERRGWGMAPPEKIYLAIEMLYRGDRYYANLLLDTPEAGILDLLNMTEEDAEDWLDSWRNLMMGIDGFKVPVLYGHDQPAVWIPLNRPPNDMLYDQTTLKYAAICAAGYGIQLSDIGLGETSGEKTLAGVIRGERQTRRTGRAETKARVENFFDRILPDHLHFIFEEKDEDAKKSQGSALSTYGLALGQLKRDGLLSPEEARLELVSTGLMETEIDPTKVPEPEVPMGMPGQPMFQKPGKQQQPGKPTDEERGKVNKQDRGKVPPEEGGRGGTVARSLIETPPKVPGADAFNDLERRMTDIVSPSMDDLVQRAGRSFTYRRGDTGLTPLPRAPRVRRLIKATVNALLPSVQRSFNQLDDEAIKRTWLPGMLAMDLDEPSELNSFILRQEREEIRDILERHLEDDRWWKVASAWEKDKILDIFKSAYEFGLHEMALSIVRSLYEEALVSSPELSLGIDFSLVNKRTLAFLESEAAQLVTHVDQGTKHFIKRVVVAGVRQGLARPRIAAAIRDGARAADILRDDGFMEDAIEEILGGLQEMSTARSESIVLTEVNRATNLGHLEQIKKSGLAMKGWVHLGPRGISPKGNEHPCPFCTRNEERGFIGVDELYETVFKSGGPENDGRARVPPAHPNVCHCRVIFDEQELFEVVERGEYMPYLGE